MTGRLLVTPATSADADAYAAVFAAVAHERRWILTEPPLDAVAFADRVRTTIAEGRDTLLALRDHGGEGGEDGEVVGTLGLHATAVPGVASLGMCIVAAARGRGGGRLLLEAALAAARESGLAKVELEVWPDNGRAIALYARHGFQVEGLRRAHHPPPRSDPAGRRRDILLMALLL